MNLLIDMDGVICSEEKTFERAIAYPLPGAKESLAALRKAGHQIIIYTARSWSELEMTKNWLNEHQIEYDGLHMGKPVADRILDDRAINFNGWPSALELINTGKKLTVDSLFLKTCKDQTSIYIEEVLARKSLMQPILQINAEDSDFELNFGLSQVAINRNKNLLEALAGTKKRSIGTIIIPFCMEQIVDIVDAPKILSEILVDGGLIVIVGWWNKGLTLNANDYWRISSLGYLNLFSKYFENKYMGEISAGGRVESPIAFKCEFQKKRI
jgi:hypothetical protein